MNRVKIIGYDYTNLNSNDSKVFSLETKCNIADEKDFIRSFLRYMNNKRDNLNIITADLKEKTSQRSNNADYYFLNDDENWSGNIVGTYTSNDFKYPENGDLFCVELELRSRFDSKRPFFLARMMLSMLSFNNLSSSDMAIASMDDLFDFLLVYKFRNEMKEAYKQGLFRSYQRFERNDDKLKGTIDVARHIKLNAGMNNGKVAYSYREQTVDNSLNHLFLHAFSCIEKRFSKIIKSILMSDQEFKAIISKLFMSCNTFYESNVKQIMSKHKVKLNHPYYQKYETLRKTSMDILLHKGLAPFSDTTDNPECPYMLFYVPDLWESFVEDILGKELMTKHIDIKTQVKTDIFESKNKFTRNIRPDYVLWCKDNKPFMIIDAKYRPGWGTIAKKGLDNKKYYSDYDKCIRDMNAFNVNTGGVIFPTEDKDYDDDDFKHKISEYNSNYFYTFPLYIDKSDKTVSSFREYNEQLNANIEYYVEKAVELIYQEVVNE